MSPARVVIAASLLVSACSYAPPNANNSDDDGTSPDAPTTPDSPDGSDAPPREACSAPDSTGLVLCLEFDDGVDDGTLLDSSPAHRDATTSGLSPATRTVPGNSPAAQIGATSTTRVPQDPALDLSTYTLAAWVHPDSLPQTSVDIFGVVDHENQYAMLIGFDTISPSIESRCVNTDVGRYEYTDVLPMGAWSFLACTYDGTRLCAYHWNATDGGNSFCHDESPPNATGAQGLAIGHLSDTGVAQNHFDGAIDSVQVFDRAVTENKLCAAIGQAAGCMPCQAGDCPSE